jgi:PAS domain S-box-containing protein
MKYLKALLIEDSQDDAFLLLRHLESNGYRVEYQLVETEEGTVAALSSKAWDVVLSDYNMPGFSGLLALGLVKRTQPDTPFIMISGTIGEETAVAAMLAGADDFFVKGNLARLVPAIERELKEADSRRQKRLAEWELEESKKRLQLAMTAAGLGVWEWNLETGAVFWSPECYEILGADQFAGTYEAFELLMHRDDVHIVPNAMRRAVENRTNFDVEFRVVSADGQIRWLSSHGTVEYWDDGHPARLIGTINDITKRKDAETRIRESEENFRALEEASAQIIWTASERGPGEELCGWFSSLSGRRITGAKGIVSILHPDDRRELWRAWNRAVRERTIFTAVGRFRSKSGGFCHLAIRGVQVFNDDGVFRQWFGAINDISDRKLAELAIEKNEAQLRLITDTVPTGIAYIDTDLRVRFANEPCMRWFCGKKEKVIGKRADEIFDGETYRRILPEFAAALEGRSATLERPSVLDGGKRYLRLTYAPDLDVDGKVRGFFAFIIDLTDLKQAEERLRRSEEQLLQSQKLESIGRLAGGIAHDFNNLLTVINGYSELGLRRLAQGDPQRGPLEEIKKAGERSADLTRQLLAFGRQQVLELKPLDLNHIITDSMAMLRRLIGEDVKIVTHLDPKAGSIEGDQTQISQILINMVVNSRDAMPTGGTVTIETKNCSVAERLVLTGSVVEPGEYVRLTVADTGCGIGEEERQHIFEPFYTTKEPGKGTGLGLSTVYGIVAQSNGYISLESVADEGARFEIYLPQAVGESPPSHPEPEPAPELGSGTATILLVEDEDIVRSFTRQILESEGYTVVDAPNGPAAIDAYERISHRVDLLLTDVVMPEMSGRELAETLLSRQPDLEILFTSGYLDDATLKHGIEARGMSFLPKPFSGSGLAAKIRAILYRNK